MPRPSHLTRLTLTASLALAASATPAMPPQPGTPAHADSGTTETTADVSALLDRQYAGFLATMPQITSLLGLPGAAEAAHRLDDLSLQRRDQVRALMQAHLAQLQAINPDSLAGQARWSVDSAIWLYERQLALTAPDWAVSWLPMAGVYAVDHLFGPATVLAQFLTEQHTIASQEDAEAYLSRLQAVGHQLDQVIANIDRQSAHGVLPPRAALDAVADQLRSLMAPAPADSLFVTAMARHLDAVDSLDAAARAALLTRAQDAVITSVQPGYARLLARVDAARARQQDNHGVWALPGGDAWYDDALRWQTSTDLDADAIHAIGIREVARIDRAMDAILRAQGLTDGTVAERVQILQTAPEHTYPDTPAGRDEVIADIHAALEKIEPHLDAWFGRRPDAPLQVRPVPAHAQDSAPGGYYTPPSLDGTRPGVFYINLGVMDHARWALPTLAYHEGAPGHHFQIALGQSLTELPLLRRTLNPSAFTEGWALYTEQLAAEMGLYADDPLGDLGRLQAEMFRAVRLVVDTGLHRKRWPRAQAMAYMREHTGLPDNDVRIEIDRYLVQPGQACSYKMGHLRLVALRQRAEQALGDRFDIRAFHDLILGNGALPLAVVEHAVDDWIQAQLADASTGAG